jgi:hypothetical protein
LPEEPERIGARCPVCREPLYERPVAPEPWAGDREGQCVTHPASAAVGTCGRCGNYMCVVCRSRWRRRSVCLACLERDLQSQEASPEEERVHFLQALWALIFGVAAWALALVGVLFIVIPMLADPEHPSLVGVVVGVLIMLVAPVLAVPGLGLGATAIRSRGDHMILATIGLILSALMAGAIIGFQCLSAWRN